jgi:alkylation response protein AidB-like acyl-CoA dehydrogenase
MRKAVCLRKEAACLVEQCCANLGYPHRSLGSIEQCRAELVLQAFDVLRQRWLRGGMIPEGTTEIQTLIIGREILGISALT